MAQNFRKKLYPNYKKRKKKIHPDDKPPEERYKNIRDAEQAVQDADMEEGNYLQDPEQPWNPIELIQEVFAPVQESGEVWDESRQEFLIKKVAPFAQKVDDKLTNVTGQNWVGDRARNVINFGADVLAPTSGDLAVGAAVLPLTVADGPLPFGDAAAGTIAGIKYGTGVGSRISAKLDDWLLNPIFSKANRAITPEGVELSPTHMMSVSKGAGSNKKTGKFLSTPDKVRRDILLGKKPKPTLEELDQAVVRGGNEVQGWRYDRKSVTGFSDDLAKQLQKEFGGTDAQIKKFQNIQKSSKTKLLKDIKTLNKKMQFDYLEFANTAVQEGERLGRKLTDEDIYEIFVNMARNPRNADLFDLGHEISAKNIARQQRKGKLTTADYKSNMGIEIKKSIKDLIFRENAAGEIIPAPRQAMEVSSSATNTNVLRNVEAGNIARGSRTDAPKVIQLLKGVSPNVETEYLRFLDPQFNKILTDIVPPDKHDELMNFVRNGIKEWQGKGKDTLLGKQQLDQYPKKLRQLVDDYLNLQDIKPYEVLKEDVDLMKSLKIKRK